MILPSDPLVVPQPGFRSDFVEWSEPTRSDRARYRVHRLGLMIEAIEKVNHLSLQFIGYIFFRFLQYEVGSLTT